MAVVKLSSSGRAVQFITDDGVLFQTSVSFFRGLLEGRSPSGFVLLTRMPWRVSKSRFKPSPVFNPVSGEKEVYVPGDDGESSGGGVGDDSLGRKSVVRGRSVRAFEDKKVW